MPSAAAAQNLSKVLGFEAFYACILVPKDETVESGRLSPGSKPLFLYRHVEENLSSDILYVIKLRDCLSGDQNLHPYKECLGNINPGIGSSRRISFIVCAAEPS